MVRVVTARLVRRPRRAYRARVQKHGLADAMAAAHARKHDPEIQRKVAEAQRELWAVDRALKIQKARGSGFEALQAFIELCMPDPEEPDNPAASLFVVKPHHRVLMEMVAAVEAKKSLRSSCSMPPQHGKSLILARYGLAWILGRNPHMRVLFATYADSLAETRGDELRAVLQMEIYRQIFPKAVLKRGSQSKTEMVFEAGGSINLVGRGTGTTGRPCDLFVIDDPYKDQEEALSAATLRKVKDWYSSVVFSRCHALTPILLVHTRWNEDDLIGWLTDPHHPDNRADPDRIKAWKHVNLPTPVDDPKLAKALGLPVGSPLWPERFPLHHLAEAKRNDPRVYAALYQGRPTPEDGAMFRADMIVTYRPEELPKNLRYYAASDHAVRANQRADATVLLVVGVDEENTAWVVDCWWDRKTTDVVVEAMIDMMQKWNPLWWRAGADQIARSIGPFLRKRMLERRVFCNVIESSEAGDKVQKAQSLLGRMAMKKLRLPAGAPWLVEARAELLKFPHGKHDDWVDAASHLGRGLRTLWGAAARPGNGTGAPANDDGGPKVGTLQWIKWASDREREARLRARRLRRM
ncbi:MAG: terminase family protein [Bryobacteraceae bacterium]|nr:terminase family protein [Bryobacteraceae bacterium]